MKNEWRYKAKTVSKYNPINRDETGTYIKDDWVGFFQIGQKFSGEELTLKTYLSIEQKYIKAAILFFKFHECSKVIIRNIEKNNISNYFHSDFSELQYTYNDIYEGKEISVKDLDVFIKLSLREFIWAEFFCSIRKDVVLRFGYDLYMYLNSTSDMPTLIKKIEELGLFVE